MRILIIEDDRDAAAYLVKAFREVGHVADHAADGVTGYDLAREGGYDSVVLDIMLPGMSGYRVCQALRAAENWVPVLVLSAKDGEYDQADALDLGADDYLTKPFSYVVLAARLRALLRRGVAPRPPVLRCGRPRPHCRHKSVLIERGRLTPRPSALTERGRLTPRPSALTERGRLTPRPLWPSTGC